MTMNKLLIAMIGVLATVVILGACSHEPDGIFASIEREQLIDPSDLGENLTINGMTRFGDTYYVATGRLNRRSINSTDWNGIPQPAGFDAAIATGVGVVNDGGAERLFVALLDADALRSALYEINSNTNNWGSALYRINEQITRLIVANDEIFVVIRKGNRAYDLIHVDIGGTVTTLLENQAAIVDGDYLPATGRYIFVGVARIFTVAASSLDGSSIMTFFPGEYIVGGDATLGTVADNENFGGVLVVPGTTTDNPDTIYISSRKGRLFRSEQNGDANTWSRITAGSSELAYTDMVRIPQLNGGMAIGVMDNRASEGGYAELPRRQQHHSQAEWRHLSFQ